MPEFRRNPNRLGAPAYVGRGLYFVTICTRGRRPVFQDPELVSTLLTELDQTCAQQNFSLYAYCFMPDHVRLELVGTDDQSNLPEMLREFKGHAAARARLTGVRGVWQKGYYDHVLRPGENEDAVAWYIFNNPVRKNLVSDPRAWPHTGSWMFDWRKAVAPSEEFVPPWKKIHPPG
jgi:putative transposase